jgi:hypothetical protein
MMVNSRTTCSACLNASNCGLGLEDITAEAAMTAGNIKKIFASESTRSYGQTSMARVTVYGE